MPPVGIGAEPADNGVPCAIRHGVPAASGARAAVAHAIVGGERAAPFTLQLRPGFANAFKALTIARVFDFAEGREA